MIKIVSEITGISEAEILGKSRFEQIVDARHLYIYALYKSGVRKYHIAKQLNITNATVLSAIHKVERVSCYSLNFNTLMKSILKTIK